MVPELRPDMLQLLILGLATWRISSLLVNETGPGDIFVKVREEFGFTHGFDKEILIIPDGFWGDLLSCVWCCSLFVAAGWVLFYILLPGLATWTALIFALSTMAVLVQCVTER